MFCVYLKGFWWSTTVESKGKAAFVVLLQDFKSSLFPPGGAQVDAVEAYLDNTAGEFSHCGCHG